MRVPGLVLSAASDTVAWRSTATTGVRWFLLGMEQDVPGEGRGREAAVLIRMEPGCGYPAHRHIDVEEVLVLSGGYRDERGEHGAGDYVRYEAGSIHAPIALGDATREAAGDNPACLLFAIARRGIELLGKPVELAGERQRGQRSHP